MNNAALNHYLRLMRKTGYAFRMSHKLHKNSRKGFYWGKQYLKYGVRAVKASRFVPKEKRQSIKNFI